MINSKIVEIVKTLDKNEFKKFGKFLESPYFNDNRTLIKLYGFIDKYYPDFDTKTFTKENLYKYLFPGKTYNDGTLRKLLSQMNEKAEMFLAQIYFEGNKIDRYVYLLNELMNRGLNSPFSSNIQEAETLCSSASKNEGFFYDMLNLGVMKNNFYLRNNIKTEKINFGKQSNEYLLSFFLIKFFRINYNNLIQKYNFNIYENLEFIDEIIAFVKRNSFEYESVILLYYYMFMTFYRMEEESYYLEFKKVARECANLLSRVEQFNVYATLHNYCTRKVNHGYPKYYVELFDVYNEMLARRIYSYQESEFVPVNFFRNVVKVGSKLLKFEWTRDFIENYSKKLNPQYSGNEVQLAYSVFYFNKHDYDRASEHLARIKYQTVLDKPFVYILQAQIFYETGDIESLISLDDAVRHFLQNDKMISNEVKQTIKLFFKYLNSLVKSIIKDSEDKNEIVYMMQNEMSNEEFREKDWIMEKLDQLTKDGIKQKTR